MLHHHRPRPDAEKIVEPHQDDLTDQDWDDLEEMGLWNVLAAMEAAQYSEAYQEFEELSNESGPKTATSSKEKRGEDLPM